MTPATHRSEPPPLVFWSAVGPALLWFAAAAAVLLASLAGFRACAVPANLTLAEAAAIRDEAEVLKQVRAGADPNARALVRRGILSDPEYLLTPLEAATAARHVDVVRLLVRTGAALDGVNFPILYCLSVRNGATDISSFLAGQAPSGPAPACEHVRLPL